MLVELRIEKECKEQKVIIVTDKLTDEITTLMKKLSEEQPKMIAGFKDDIVTMLNYDQIYRIYSSVGKVYAETSQEKYLIRQRLYEIENRLKGTNFVRISNSEIINLNHVKNFDLSFVGTICVTLSNRTITYVSRRYVTKIKQHLGI